MKKNFAVTCFCGQWQTLFFKFAVANLEMWKINPNHKIEREEGRKRIGSGESG